MCGIFKQGPRRSEGSIESPGTGVTVVMSLHVASAVSSQGQVLFATSRAASALDALVTSSVLITCFLFFPLQTIVHQYVNYLSHCPQDFMK